LYKSFKFGHYPHCDLHGETFIEDAIETNDTKVKERFFGEESEPMERFSYLLKDLRALYEN